jgi:hypothetical protein
VRSSEKKGQEIKREKKGQEIKREKKANTLSEKKRPINAYKIFFKFNIYRYSLLNCTLKGTSTPMVEKSLKEQYIVLIFYDFLYCIDFL